MGLIDPNYPNRIGTTDRDFLGPNIIFHVVFEVFDIFNKLLKALCLFFRSKKNLSPNPIDIAHDTSVALVSRALQSCLILPDHTLMAKKWCTCDRCDGGKEVSKTTWYKHNKQRVRVHRNAKRRRGPPPGVVPGPAGDVDVKGTSEGSRAPRSDSVGEIC